jgi:hypothetical protein
MERVCEENRDLLVQRAHHVDALQECGTAISHAISLGYVGEGSTLGMFRSALTKICEVAPGLDLVEYLKEVLDDPLGDNTGDAVKRSLSDIYAEAVSARSKFPPMNSAHEAYGVMLEEVDELWEHVKTKQKDRDLPAMRKEAIQTAAMALRFATEVHNETTGRR